MHTASLFVEPWATHLILLGLFYWKNVMGCMENGFGRIAMGSMANFQVNFLAKAVSGVRSGAWGPRNPLMTWPLAYVSHGPGPMGLAHRPGRDPGH